MTPKQQTLQEWLDEQEKLCEAATRGPWSVYHKGISKIVTIAVDIGDVPIGQRPCIVDWPGFDSCGLPVKRRVANARFIAASRLSLPKALQVIRAIIEFQRSTTLPVSESRMVEIAEKILNEK